jgi:phosphopantothenoylcysteine decarboxylase/phosphopantothenate--cysteine ligase
MGGDRNQIKIITRDGIEAWDDMPKGDVARKVIEKIAKTLSK